MAIIQSYPINNNVKDTDLLLGITNIAPSGNPIYQTKSFRVSDVRGGGGGGGTISIGTANGLSLSGTVLSLGLASSSTNGALSSANWTTFNNKQAALNGTGFVKASGSSISYDNSDYALDSAVVHNTGNEGVGGVKSFSSTIRALGGINPGEYAIEIDKSFEGEAIRVISTGAATFTLSLNGVATAASFVKSGGTSSQYLMADGSASAPSYGQLYLPTGIYYVPIAAINVWQPLGLVATLVSPSPGFSLGIVNKCAFKNISGSAKTVNVFCEIFLNTYGQAFNVDSIAIVLNGNVLQNTATPIQGVSTTLNCIIEMQDSDEISIYIRSNVTDNSAVYLFKMNIFQI